MMTTMLETKNVLKGFVDASEDGASDLDEVLRGSERYIQFVNLSPQEERTFFGRVVHKIEEETELSEDFRKRIEAVKKTYNFVENAIKAQEGGVGGATIRHAVTTTPIEDVALFGEIKEMLRIWKQQAQEYVRLALLPSIRASKEKRCVMEDAVYILHELKGICAALSKKTATKKICEPKLYISYTEERVCGVAYAARSLVNRNNLSLHFLATNPSDIDLFGIETCHRGSGTALLTHLCHTSQEYKNIVVTPLDSSESFYERLGFEPLPERRGEGILRIHQAGMRVLLNQRPETHTILQIPESIDELRSRIQRSYSCTKKIML